VVHPLKGRENKEIGKEPKPRSTKDYDFMQV
jgi:hypothetical protein